MGKVTVPKKVLEGLEAVRRSGLTNMLDRPRVAELAEELGFPEAAEWVRRNPKLYATGIFAGLLKAEDAEMCGIAGVIVGAGRRRNEHYRLIASVFTRLLLLSQRRGVDASGVAVVRKDGTFRLLKRPCPARELVGDAEYRSVMALDGAVTAVLGHARWKTCGSEQNNRNNHPIQAGSILGTHNGHISNADALAAEMGLLRKAEVDSEVLFRLAERAKDVRGFVGMLPKIEGSLSAAYVDLREPRRVMLLKGDRPLSAVHVRQLDCVFYASEGWMLGQALEGLGCEELPLEWFALHTFDVRNLDQPECEDVEFGSPLLGDEEAEEEFLSDGAVCQEAMRGRGFRHEPSRSPGIIYSSVRT